MSSKLVFLTSQTIVNTKEPTLVYWTDANKQIYTSFGRFQSYLCGSTPFSPDSSHKSNYKTAAQYLFFSWGAYLTTGNLQNQLLVCMWFNLEMSMLVTNICQRVFNLHGTYWHCCLPTIVLDDLNKDQGHCHCSYKPIILSSADSLVIASSPGIACITCYVLTFLSFHRHNLLYIDCLFCRKLMSIAKLQMSIALSYIHLCDCESRLNFNPNLTQSEIMNV